MTDPATAPQAQDHVAAWCAALPQPIVVPEWIANMATGQRIDGVLNTGVRLVFGTAAEQNASIDGRYGKGASQMAGTAYGEADFDLIPMYMHNGWPLPVSATDVMDARMLKGAVEAIMAAYGGTPGSSQDAAARHQAAVLAWWRANPDSPRPPDLAWHQEVGEIRGPRYTATGTWTQLDAKGHVAQGGKIFWTVYSTESVLGWFFSPDDVQCVVKVVNADSEVLVFGGTDLQLDITVTNQTNGRTYRYHNPAGTLALPQAAGAP
jgi:hypothetical protein